MTSHELIKKIAPYSHIKVVVMDHDNVTGLDIMDVAFTNDVDTGEIVAVIVPSQSTYAQHVTVSDEEIDKEQNRYEKRLNELGFGDITIAIKSAAYVDGAKWLRSKMNEK